MADVFISYAREDRLVAEALATLLGRAGVEVWWDRDLIAGANYRKTIRDELDACTCAIVIWTPSSVMSNFVWDEAAVAHKEEKLLPLALPDLRPPLGFASIHTLEFTERNGELTLPSVALFEWIEPRLGRGLNVPADLAEYQAAPVAAAPTRPHSMRGLGFRPRPPVQWFDPRLLVTRRFRSAVDGYLAGQFGREEFGNAEAFTPTRYADKDGVWVDWLANTGDSFDTTYTMARVLSQAAVDLLDHPSLRRGHVLVVGGNKVYPLVDRSTYRDAFVGPFRTALPWWGDSESPPPDLFGLPGPNDRFDRGRSFRRVFCGQRPLGGWRTRQSTPYFAIKLPGRWWLWGVDVARDGEVSPSQESYFRVVGREDLEKGDGVVVCITGVSLLDEAALADSMSGLLQLVRASIEPVGARLALVLSGGSHFYARYESSRGHKLIVAGGGGAFLEPTHSIRAEFPTDELGLDTVTQTRSVLHALYPSRWDSRKRARDVLSFPVRNREFLPPMVAVHMAFALVALDRVRDAPGVDLPLASVLPPTWGEILRTYVHSPVSLLMAGLILVALVKFAQPPGRTPRRARVPVKVAMGVVHGLLHGGLSIVAVMLATRLPHPSGSWLPPTVAVVAGVLGGLLSGFLVGGYLWICASVLNTHSRVAYSAFRSSKFKNFVRMRFHEDGSLVVYPIAVEGTVRRWRADPYALDRSGPEVVPVGERHEPTVRLIEGPIPVPREAPVPSP